MVVLMILAVPVFLMYRKSRNDASAQTALAESSQTLSVTAGTTISGTRDVNTPKVTLVFTEAPVITVATVTPTDRPSVTPTLVPPAVFTAPDLATPTKTLSLSVGQSPTAPVIDLSSPSD
jgi:hypothetical protein